MQNSKIWKQSITPDTELKLLKIEYLGRQEQADKIRKQIELTISKWWALYHLEKKINQELEQALAENYWPEVASNFRKNQL